MLRRSTPRRAASLVETALTFSAVMLLTLGVVVVALGVFAYQEVAGLAREGARWAAVHGAQYHQETGKPMATASSVYTNAIKPHMVGLDTSQLTYSVSWTNASEVPIYDDGSGNLVQNQVTVTVTYRWVPHAYLAPVTLRSTSVMPMQY
jgi:Flp pilus assembly protein TadG